MSNESGALNPHPQNALVLTIRTQQRGPKPVRHFHKPASGKRQEFQALLVRIWGLGVLGFGGFRGLGAWDLGFGVLGFRAASCKGLGVRVSGCRVQGILHSPASFTASCALGRQITQHHCYLL